MNPSLKILIVEDDQSLRNSIIKFASAHHEFVVAADLASARAQLERTKIDLVLLDKTLPDGNGIELIPEIKRRSSKMAIIVMTGDDGFASVTKSLSLGADDYLVKSENLIDDLLIRIPLAANNAYLKSRQLKSEHKLQLSLPKNKCDITSASYSEFVCAAERAFFNAALKLYDGDKSGLANALGLARSGVFKKLANLGIPRRKWRIREKYLGTKSSEPSQGAHED